MEFLGSNLDQYLELMLGYLRENPGWAVAIVFLISFGEALLIIGLFVPSTAVLIGAGTLVGTGHLAFWPIFIGTAVGAIAGDQLSYWAGRLFGERLKTLWPLNRFPKLLENGETYVRAHGGKSIAFGRFIPGIKAVVPGIVGMFGMSQTWFTLVNVTSGIVWTAMHVFPGILIGQGLALAGELSGRLLIVVLVLLAILLLAGWIIRVAVAMAWPMVSHALGHLSLWARRRGNRYLRRFGRAVAPDNPRSVLVVVFAAVALVTLVTLVRMAINIFDHGAFFNVDLSINRLMQSLRNAPADELMTAITMMGDTIVLSTVAATIIVWLVAHRAWRAALAAALTMGLGSLFVPLMRLWIHRPRPIDAYTGAQSFNFPSSYMIMATIVFGVLAVLASHSMGRWGRAIVFATCGLAAIALGYSRIYLGAHWTSDVLGGFLFGAVMTAAFGIAIEAVPLRRVKPWGLMGASMIAFILAGSVHVGASYTDAAIRFAPRHELIQETLADWENGGWEKLPSQRIDLAGKPEETFAAQWVGDLPRLTSALASNGYRVVNEWTWRDSIPYLDPTRALADMAPRPALHEGLKAAETLIKPIEGDDNWRLTLRIWRSDVRVAEMPVYLISLTRETLKRQFSLYAIPSLQPATAQEVAELIATLKQSGVANVVALQETVTGDTRALLLANP